MHIGFIDLGNVGGKLAGSLVRNGLKVTVRDLERTAADDLLAAGARFGESAAQMATVCDVVITSLPCRAASAIVVEGAGGILEGLIPGTVWAEMSTTDEAEEPGYELVPANRLQDIRYLHKEDSLSRG